MIVGLISAYVEPTSEFNFKEGLSNLQEVIDSLAVVVSQMSEEIQTIQRDHEQVHKVLAKFHGIKKSNEFSERLTSFLNQYREELQGIKVNYECFHHVTPCGVSAALRQCLRLCGFLKFSNHTISVSSQFISIPLWNRIIKKKKMFAMHRTRTISQCNAKMF